MSRLNSSISSSEPPAGLGWGDSARVLAWTLAWLAVIDVGASVAFPPPGDPKERPSALQSYFQYGRSIEDKLDRLVGRTDSETAPIAFAGWIDPPQGEGQPRTRAAGSDLMVAFYGMSFSGHVGEALKEAEPSFTIRNIAGPSAPASQVLALYEADRGRHEGDVVVLSVLDSAVAALLATNGFCRNFDGPLPYMFPRYYIGPRGLGSHEPPARSLAEFRTLWYDPEGRARVIDDIRKWDLYYTPFLFHKSLLDESTVVRLLRRALATGGRKSIEGYYLAGGRFIEGSEPVRCLQGIVDRFIVQAQADGKRPFVLMIQDGTSGSRLQAVLGPTIAGRGALGLNTDAVCPTSESANFLPDGHITHEANRRIAEAMAALLRSGPVRSASTPAANRGLPPG
ncbi:hypothetical protein [Paludisphaera mucosa]|uniref:SGNH/GDSL hydrolase family protein n=1 Tax=Paludisphaera mucosa TaxID=3030827 RepID=A0ABT6F5A2_9BACT|nr:hypothetical protein [Paludisphaera mucosa]MDG3002599.1 hypothetical protein [Paludisphaera mucosa]